MFSVARRRLTALSGVAVLAMAAACSPTASNGTSGAQAGPGAALQPASTASGGMTSFTDPTENAFTVSVPQGWSVKGGIQRSGQQAKPWLLATSPDGATSIMVGDPSVPMFTLPSGSNAPGSTLQTPGGASPVEPYENAVQFAADYAQRAYGAQCGQLTPAANQPEPGLAQAAQAQGAQLASSVNAPAPPINAFDGASETFSCQANGVADVVGVLDVTYLFQTPVGGFWNVPTIESYRTPASSQAQTDQLVRAIKQSWTPNPQWQAQQQAAASKTMAAQEQQGAQAMAALTKQEAQGNAMLRAQAASENAQLNAEHAATMNWLNTQGQRINQNFAAQQASKASGQQAEMRYINNQQCIRWNDAAHTSCAATAPN